MFKFPSLLVTTEWVWQWKDVTMNEPWHQRRMSNPLRLGLFNVDLVVLGTCYIWEFKALFNGTMKRQNCKIRGAGQRSNMRTYIKGYLVPHIKNHYLLISPATSQIFGHLEVLRHTGRNSSHWSYRRDKFSLLFKSQWVPHGKHYFTIMILGTYITSNIWKHRLNSHTNSSWWHFEDLLFPSMASLVCFIFARIPSFHPPPNTHNHCFKIADQNNTQVKSLLNKTNISDK